MEPRSPEGPELLLLWSAGVTDIIDSALEEGVPVALVGGTCSAPGEGATSAAAFALGPRRAGRIRFFTLGELVGAAPARDGRDGGSGGGEAQSFEAAIAAAKAQVCADCKCVKWYRNVIVLLCIPLCTVRAL